KGTLPSDTVSNPKNDNYCMVITTRSGRVFGPMEETEIRRLMMKRRVCLNHLANKPVVIDLEPDETEKNHVETKEAQ
ncbi:hypothetical protein HAX54_029145, partial [Datura stramonium]|nr:hypothetical protein [Datura stramonium]